MLQLSGGQDAGRSDIDRITVQISALEKSVQQRVASLQSTIADAKGDVAKINQSVVQLRNQMQTNAIIKNDKNNIQQQDTGVSKLEEQLLAAKEKADAQNAQMQKHDLMLNELRTQMQEVTKKLAQFQTKAT